MWWCSAEAIKEINEDVLATIDQAVKRGAERGIELAKQDALARIRENKARKDSSDR